MEAERNPSDIKGGDGRWEMGGGRWAMGDGRWATGDDGLLLFSWLYIVASSAERATCRAHVLRKLGKSHKKMITLVL